MAFEPSTLQEAVQYFADPVNCRSYVAVRRWPRGVSCPRCGGASVVFLEKYNRWQCSHKHDRRQFTEKTGTILEDSALPLEKWLLAMWLVANCRNGVSCGEVHRAVGVTQKTAWFMLYRIRYAMWDEDEKCDGENQGANFDRLVRRVLAVAKTDPDRYQRMMQAQMKARRTRR